MAMLNPCHPGEILRDNLEAAELSVTDAAARAGRATIVVRSGDLHRAMGGYPGPDHRMPMCCNVMYAELVEGLDEVLSAPPSGLGASVAIEYLLPRPGADGD